ncbi:thioesterase II family protein [Yinghuangia seranimata]|uniref:thioesterase II family protein n=1 Tax=Yinghuangia seranimata TaxID=408067 RepID=UPI00248BED67|nr:thioesterase domain-containing protein [Yinghuangia seranimata]MDI2127657.1 thioesterase domain-containing protein [Yinghuangia seranimata]
MSQISTTTALAVEVGRRVPQLRASVALVGFPHAGGNASMFRQWPERLAPDVEVWHGTLPRQGVRAGTAPVPAWPDFVNGFAERIAAEVDRPVALFGQSLGSVVAFEVARALTALGVPPVHLVVAARSAPTSGHAPAVPDDDGELVELVDRLYGGIPDVVRADPELLAYFLPVLRADLRLAASYRFVPGPPLDCPITAFAGDRDPTVRREGLRGWADLTTGRFTAHMLTGGHFALHNYERDVLRTIRAALVA